MKKLVYKFSRLIAGSSLVLTTVVCGAQTNSVRPAMQGNQMKMASPVTDTGFVRKSIMDNMMEIRLSEIARDNASNTDIKELAEMMITDHSNTLNDLRAIGDEMGVADPDTTAMSLPQGDNTPGDIFDKTWVTQMLAMHKTKVTELENASTKLKDPKLKATALSALPKVKLHVQMLEKIAPTVGAATQ